jgi:acyl-CoA reductase-like NAD-dependent aldehyde dehydrogenase
MRRVSPTLLDTLGDSTDRVVFAPIALLIKYEKVEEAIEIANGTRYGLGASVWGPDQRDCVAVAKQLECGMVSVNDFGVFYVSPCDSCPLVTLF